ncbi:GGDEF domain-containing protein [Methylobacterium sp. NEAU K]|uniref:GGDEF domain-containing protein n=1 Tax=Methylobacterium sp. NEAU K TaxID=3064946 RepID=UPI00273693D2|nr:GGDEF domain-containing protein [Methylobacterium sp. NEAU K]MDP4003876.1 GGDEF domain-containing protein [Methylobacterium sp. NEAU K]
MPDAARNRSGTRYGADIADDGGAAHLAAELALRAAIIREQEALLSRRERALGAAAGLWTCRLSDQTLDWTGGVHGLFGIPPGAPLHRARILELYEPASRRLLETIRERAILGCGTFRLDSEIVTAQGRRRWIRISAAVEAEGGRPTRIAGMKQDVTEEIARLAELTRRADRDPLTGLANRRAFEERFHAGAYLARPAQVGALILVDLDDFKRINDTHGHAAGDLCIRRAAARLAAVCRHASLVARIGGDEFAVLLQAPADPRGLVELGRRIVAVLGRPIVHRSHAMQVGASVGIAPGGGSPAELFSRADAALYAAKDGGRNAVRIDYGPRRSAAGAP